MPRIAFLSTIFVCALFPCWAFCDGSAQAENGESGEAWSPATYACGRVGADTPIRVDGVLDDAAWEEQHWTGSFVDIEGSKRPNPWYDTKVKMAWDNEYIYFAAEMEEEDLWATYTERDSIIYHENDFEVFIDPDGDTHLYAELEINALNTVWDLMLVRPYRDGGPAVHSWDIPGLKTAVHLRGTLNDPSDRDEGWSVEIAIPFTALAELTSSDCPPKPGDRWRINFSRVQWLLNPREGGYDKQVDKNTGKSLPEQNWVWTPQRVIAMHEPEYWGFVEFREQGDTDREVEIRPEDRARFALRTAYDTARASSAESVTGVPRPSMLPTGWLWPPDVDSGAGWFRLTMHDGSGRSLWIDHEGAMGEEAPKEEEPGS
ncbi:MAG: carbohydrate-binding family 9-like protein [Planctomycetota bacterium]